MCLLKTGKLDHNWKDRLPIAFNPLHFATEHNIATAIVRDDGRHAVFLLFQLRRIGNFEIVE